MIEPELLDEVVTAVRAGSRYRNIHIDLVRRIAQQELNKRRNLKEVVKATRNKLHQIGGAYQEESIRYDQAYNRLITLPTEWDSLEVREFCQMVMRQHASTRERLSILDVFFKETLRSIVPLRSVLDLACGLNPMALPWMPVSSDVFYTACDIYEDMSEFLQNFFVHFGLMGRVGMCDLTQPFYAEPVQVAFLLKTIPCLEQIDKSIGASLLDSIPAEHLLVSFPAHSLGGRSKGMVQNYETHFHDLLVGRDWQVQRFEFKTELAFLLSRS